MAAPGGGRLWSTAWKWFSEAKACDEVEDLRKNIGHLPAVPEPVKEVYQGLPEVSGSVLCFGCTGYIGEAVVFDAVRRGLHVTVFVRQHSVDRFSELLRELKILDRVSFAVGEATVPADVEKAMRETKATCCISLLASAQVTNEQSIHDIDYGASHTVVQAARKCGIKQFIYCSDTGCYQPALACQMHKLRIEGELMRCLPDGLQWTIVRPTTYHPYVVSAIQLNDVRQGKNVNLFGSAGNAGDLALYNPIAREDLGRFIVSCVLNQGTYGRVLAVGGPWTSDNVSTLKDTTNWMIEYVTPAGTTPSSVKPLGMDLSVIIYGFMEALGVFSKQLKKVATIVFFYTKYWSTVCHFSPATGIYPVQAYTKELCEAVTKDPEGFSKFIVKAKSSTTASVIFPTPRNSWWDIAQSSLPEDQIPMGAGKPKQSLQAGKQHAAGLELLRSMAPGVCIGELPDDDDESWVDFPESDTMSDGIDEVDSDPTLIRLR